MRKRSHITVVEGETPVADGSIGSSDDALVLDADDLEHQAEVWDEFEPAQRSIAWVAPAIALVAIATWSAFYIWANRAAMFAGGTPQQWSSWITAWAIPVLLVVSLWLLATRNSTREAARFGEVARNLAEESASLELRLTTVNRELSLAREFLGSQTRDLEFLGRSAADRISEHAARLQDLVVNNGKQVDAIATVSSTALENMTRLRDNLPVISNSAKDVSNQIGGAGRTAQDQLGKLVDGFERLNDFGAASERQVISLRARVDDALEAFEAQAGSLEASVAARFAALRETSDNARTDLGRQEVEALSAIRSRSEALRGELAEVHQSASAEEELALSAMRDRVAALRDEAAGIANMMREGEQAAINAWDGQVKAMKARLLEAVEEIQRVDANATDAASTKLRAIFEEADKNDARIEERSRQFEAETLRRIDALAAAQGQVSADLGERLAAIDTAIAERREAQSGQMAALGEECDALGEQVAALGTTFTSIALQGSEARETLNQAVATLSATLVESREALDGTDMAVAALTDASVRLLELIQASARQSRDELPLAMEASEQRLAAIEHRSTEIHALLDQARESGELLIQRMEKVEGRTREAMAGFDSFQSNFGETTSAQIDSIERLRAGVAALDDESSSVAQRVQGELRDAINALQTTARSALSAIDDEQAGRITEIAEQLGARSAEAIERALSEQTDEALASLDQARERSTEAARGSAQQLRDQLARLNDLTVNLESRIAHARDKATDTIDGDFARRVALITESLNSNAIDITRVLSAEVTDTAWANYLRGDRGIFTRRAVRLLDNSETREIVSLYDADNDFRSHVNRYIHDFEAMLRTLLSTRDGNAVSVTLLSSDMGKLYVALAQALERLRQ